MFLYCTNCIFYHPTPTLHLNLPLTGNYRQFLNFTKHSFVCFLSLLFYRDTGSVLINHVYVEKKRKVKVTWWPILGIRALRLSHPKCTHTQQWTHTHREHTHTMNTHTAVNTHTHCEHTHTAVNTHREHTHTHTPWTHTQQWTHTHTVNTHTHSSEHTHTPWTHTHCEHTHTHSSEHTHTVNTHLEQWAVIYAAAPGEQSGVQCLAQEHLSRGIEGGESAGHSLPPHLQFLPARDSNSQPLDYESTSLTIRPRLPL